MLNEPIQVLGKTLYVQGGVFGKMLVLARITVGLLIVVRSTIGNSGKSTPKMQKHATNTWCPRLVTCAELVTHRGLEPLFSP